MYLELPLPSPGGRGRNKQGKKGRCELRPHSPWVVPGEAAGRRVHILICSRSQLDQTAYAFQLRGPDSPTTHSLPVLLSQLSRLAVSAPLLRYPILSSQGLVGCSWESQKAMAAWHSRWFHVLVWPILLPGNLKPLLAP